MSSRACSIRGECLDAKATTVVLSRERGALQAWLRSQTLPARKVTRARIVLLAVDGWRNLQIAEKLGIERATVQRWREA